MRSPGTAVAALTALLASAAPATAHVDVLPREAAQGAAVEITAPGEPVGGASAAGDGDDGSGAGV